MFKGKKGIKTAYDLALKEKNTIHIYGAEGRFAEILPAYQKEWNERRAKSKIPMKIIWSEQVREKKIKDKLKLIQTKFLPRSYEFPSLVMVTGDLVITVVWTEMPFAFLIRSKEAVKSNLNFFDILWKVAKE